MTKKSDIEVLPEDRINLTQEQQNLIELALRREIPIEDAKVMEMLKKGVYIAAPPSGTVQTGKDEDIEFTDHPFNRFMSYYTEKYGLDFGMIYISAIQGGEEQYKTTIEIIERMKATERIERQKANK